MKKLTAVPLPVYEQEMKFKNRVIIMLLFILGVTITLFISFISSYDFVGYEQNGEGINNINSGSQGDILNESTIESTN